MASRNLVIAAVGDDSLRESWLIAREQRDFDVLLVYYGDGGNRYESDAEYYWREKGLKWPLMASVATRFADRIAEYDAIWCPDDDLEIDASGVNTMFEWFHRLEASLAQP